MFDIHVTFVHFKFYPWTFQEVPKTTPICKLAAKAAIVTETPVRDSKPSPKKTVTPKKDKKDVDKETPIKGTPKVSKSEEVVEVPPSLEKKRIRLLEFYGKRWSKDIWFKGNPSGTCSFQSPRSDC